MLRRWLVAIAGALLTTATSPALAGGSWLETDHDHYAPGDLAVARGAFGDGTLEGTVEDGPFYLYLVPGYRWLPRHGSIPDWAEHLGPLSIKESTGNVCCWVASARFTVPDVPPGRYSLDYCNEPCTLNGIGDLMGASFIVADTEREAQLAARVDRLQQKIPVLRKKIQHFEEDARKLAENGRELAVAREQIVELKEELADFRSRRAPAESTAGSRPLLPAWGIVLVFMSLTALAVALIIRGRRVPTVPDFVPEALTRETEATSRRGSR
jgi:hypothetical protein